MPIRELIGLPLEPLDTEGEDIAAAAHRFDHRRLFRVDLQLAPKPPYLNVDRPVFRPSLPIAGEIEQPVAGQHLIGVVDEGREQRGSSRRTGPSIAMGSAFPWFGSRSDAARS